MPQLFHSVRLDKERCKGCNNCVKRCPTQAIRVRDGKAKILEDLCIDCGECIRVCPHHAKKAYFTPFSELSNPKYEYRIALPAPSLYCQFSNLDDVDYVLTGLKRIGFDNFFEVSAAAEIISDYTRKYMSRPDVKKPVISGACPAVVRLIETRFHDLTDHILPFIAPVELAAKLARREAKKLTGLPDEKIGVFFISPCPAKVTDAIMHPDLDERLIDGVFSMSEVYVRLVGELNRITEPEPLLGSGILGVSWAISGGEAGGLLNEKYLAADGIENVIKVLEQAEDEKLNDVDFIELNACPAGCVGGVLAVENPFIAEARMKSIRKYMPLSQNRASALPAELNCELEQPRRNRASVKLSEDFSTAMIMMNEIERLTAGLPALDCGACGAPSCAALAEDVVRGKSDINLCVYRVREKMQRIKDTLTPQQLELYDDTEGDYKKTEEEK